MSQTLKYENFIYSLDGSNHKVETEPKTPEPDSVFKYYSNSKYSIDALKNSYLFATHPYSFNDSIDSSELLLNVENVTYERFVGFYKRFFTQKEFEKYDFQQMFEDDKKNSFSGFRSFCHQVFSRNFGLISLTTNPLNILMWSHYSSEDGFMIELDKKVLLDNIVGYNEDVKNYCFRPVQYVDELERIDLFQEGFTTPDLSFLYMTNVKRSEWKYEDEWRLSIYKTNMGIPYKYINPGFENYEGRENRKAHYPPESLKSIVLGKYFFNGNNCSKVSEDGSVLVSDQDFLDLIEYLIENHNDKIFMSGELQKGEKFGRSISKIKLHKVEKNKILIEELDEVHYN
jgi:hypothetical protein